MSTLPVPRAEIASIMPVSKDQEKISRSLTLTNVPEPDVLERASALAMNALELVLPDDDVAESSTVLEDEHGTVATGIGIGVASPAAVVLLVTHILRTRNDAGRGKRHDRPNSCRDVQCLASGETDSGTDEGDFETHSERWTMRRIDMERFVKGLSWD